LTGDDQIFVRNRHVAFRNIAGQMVLVHSLKNLIVTLNETGSAIWERLDGRSVGEISADIVGLFDVTPDEAKSDTKEFLQMLLEKDFVNGQDNDTDE
jgi:hypothetical protein